MRHMNCAATAKMENAVGSLISKPSMRCAWNVDADLIIAAVDGHEIPIDLDDNVNDDSCHGQRF